MSAAELLYALAAAGANVLGAVAVTSGARWSVRMLDVLLSLAAGFLVSVSVVDLFPEAIAREGARGAEVALAAYHGNEILDLPAHPVLVLEGERERLVPLVKERLAGVDLDARRLTLDWHPDD